MGVDILPRWERLLYCIGGLGSMLYCIYSFYWECQDKINLIELRPGIELLGGIKDSPDPEWSNISKQIPYLLPLLAGHVFIGHFLHSLQIEIRIQKSIRLLFDFLAVICVFGVRSTFLCLCESFLMYLLTYQGYTSAVWAAGLFFTTTLNVQWIMEMQLELVDYLGPESIAFFIAVSYVHLRLISACIEIIKNRNATPTTYLSVESASQKNFTRNKSSIRTDYNSKQDKNPEGSIIDYLTYIFYLPIFFQGPILTYDEFLPQLTMFYKSRSHNYDLKEIVKKICKIIVFAICIEVQSHFWYISSVQGNSRLVRLMSVPAVIGLGVWQGQHFHMKYLCLFGLGSVVSKLDGLTAPPPPACISWIYSFSDMWKYFDVGMYNFIKKYIYIPWGGSKAGFQRQIMGTVLAFTYVCYWHGGESSIIVWCCGNLIVIILEMTASRLEYSTLGLKLKSNLGAASFLRFKALIATPLYVASALQVMFFFFSVQTGNVMVDKMVWTGSWKTLLLEYAGFYLAIQNAMYARELVFKKHRKM